VQTHAALRLGARVGHDALHDLPWLRDAPGRIDERPLELREERRPVIGPSTQHHAVQSRREMRAHHAHLADASIENNGQIGMSFQVPIFAGASIGAQAAQSEIDVNHLKIEMANARNRIAADLQQSFRDAARSQSAAEVARLDLEVAREQVSVDLAQMQEGRLPIREMEEARVAENEKWIAFYDAQYAVEKAGWDLLHHTGNLIAALH